MAPDSIFGREEELVAVQRFLAGEPRGLRALVLEGEAGIGKSTLWREAVRIAGTDGRVFAARAAEAEAKLSFSILTDLLGPARDEVVHLLPRPQRRALEAALLLDEVDGSIHPDARAVSLAALGALRSLATGAAITLAIDDLQWTDAPTARTLAFALRRLTNEPVTLIAALRTAPGIRDPLELPTLVPNIQRLMLGPLGVAAMGEILRRNLEYRIPHPLVMRIHTSARGNPFFGLELGHALDLEVPGPGEPLPAPDDRRGLLRKRLGTLSEATRRVLLAAAASAAPTVDLVETLGGSEGALEQAMRAGIVRLRGAAIEFAHPLFGSAVYTSASPASKREVHRRLAELVTDPEERARHLALSSARPNEHVAAELDRAASHARGRGAPEAAAELFELALAATPPGHTEPRAERARSLAGNLFDAGDPPRARQILERTAAELGPGPSRAETLCLLSEFSWKDLGRVSELLKQALKEVPQDRRLQAWFHADLAWVELDSCRLVEAQARAWIAVGLAEGENHNGYLLRLSLSILALTEFLLGRPSRGLLDRAISLQGPLAPADLSSPATCLGRVLTWEGALDHARATFEAELERYREHGHETSRYEILAHLADAEYRAGHLESAARHVDEAIDVAGEAGVDVLGEILPVKAFIGCVAGDVDAALRDATEGLGVCERTNDRWNEIRCRSVLGLVELSLGNPAGAHRWLEPLTEFTKAMGLEEPGVFPFVPDEVEALVSLGELGDALVLTERLEEQGRARGRRLALGTAARCRGLIDASHRDLPTAAEELGRSLAWLGSTGHPFDLARSFLLAGEVQRRMKKKRAAREMLGRALTLFDELGASVWADRTRKEIERIGGRSPSSNGLTPTEAQVAQLVARGRTNREVAEAMFISRHTVDSNLRRIYRKLGVRSRTELAARL